MYDNDSKGISFTAGFFILIAFVLGGSIFAAMIAQPIWTNMTGKSLEALATGDFTAADGTALKIMQVINALGAFVLPTLVTAHMLNRRPLKLIGFENRGMDAKQLGLVILIMATGLLFSNSLSYFTQLIPLPPSTKAYFDALENRYSGQVAALITAKSVGEYLLAVVVMALIPALGEEVLFRGGLQNFLTRGTKNPWASIIIVSIIFSLMHSSFYGFFSRVGLGIVLGAIYYYSGTIWWSIIAHFLYNAFLVTMLHVYAMRGMPLKEMLSEKTDSYWGVFALIPLVILFIMFKDSTAKSRRRQA
jgi:membrane protease YdiL (CAAX protease family)